MDETEVTEVIEQALSEQQSGSQDGMSFTNRSADDLKKLTDQLTARQAVAGTNENGGARSPWNALRPGRYTPAGGN